MKRLRPAKYSTIFVDLRTRTKLIKMSLGGAGTLKALKDKMGALREENDILKEKLEIQQRVNEGLKQDKDNVGVGCIHFRSLMRPEFPRVI